MRKEDEDYWITYTTGVVLPSMESLLAAQRRKEMEDWKAEFLAPRWKEERSVPVLVADRGDSKIFDWVLGIASACALPGVVVGEALRDLGVSENTAMEIGVWTSLIVAVLWGACVVYMKARRTLQEMQKR